MIKNFNIDELSSAVASRMSEKRFRHTLGVCELAAYLGMQVMPTQVEELKCAALLHDIAKEISREEQLKLIDKSRVSEEDLEISSVLHAFAAPELIKRDFSLYATPNILSAVFNHTTGDPRMSLFDEIIFISDFAEAGREYPSCREVAKKLREYFDAAKNEAERILAIHRATLDTLFATVEALNRMGKRINTRTLLTKASFEAKILLN